MKEVLIFNSSTDTFYRGKRKIDEKFKNTRSITLKIEIVENIFDNQSTIQPLKKRIHVTSVCQRDP